MDRSALPPSPCGVDNGFIGGLPAVRCAAVADKSYTLPLTGQWNPGFDPGSQPALILGCSAGDVTPAPTYPVALTLSVAVPLMPVSGVPTLEDVPSSWQEMETHSETGSGFFGAYLPSDAIAGLIGNGNDFWIKQVGVDADGCVSTVYGYFPTGIPADPTAGDPTVAYVLDGDEVLTFTVPNPAAPTDPGASTDPQDLTVLADCPPAKIALAVAPQCGFPVQIDTTGGPVEVFLSGEAPEFPNTVRVSGQVSGDQGDDLKIDGGVRIKGQVGGDQGDDVKVTLGDELLTVQGNGPGNALVVIGHAGVSGQAVEIAPPPLLETGAVRAQAISVNTADGFKNDTLAAGAVAVIFSATGDPADTTSEVFMDNAGVVTNLPRDAAGNWLPFALPAMPAGFTYPALTIICRGGASAVTANLLGFFAP